MAEVAEMERLEEVQSALGASESPRLEPDVVTHGRTDGAPAEVVDECEEADSTSPTSTIDNAGDRRSALDVPEQISLYQPPVHCEPEPEPEQIPVGNRRRPSPVASPPTGNAMGLGASAIFYNHSEKPTKESGGIEVLEQRRRQVEESKKDRDTFALLENVLAEHWLTSGLTQDVLAALADSMLRRDVAPGQKVVSRGEEGSSLLILGSGECEVTGADVESDDSDDEQQATGTAKHAGGASTRLLEPGDCMGAVMLVMPGHVHVATVTATAPSTIWFLERTRFQDLVHSRTAAALQARMELLQACPWLSSLDQEQLGRLAAVGRLHCCPVGARTVFDRAPAQNRPRCRYVLEEPAEGPDDFAWAGSSPSPLQEPVYDYWNPKGASPTTGSVRPLRPQALAPTANSPTTVLVERIAEGNGTDDRNWTANGRELQLLAISGAAFRWLLGEAVCAEIQDAISHEYPITPEEAEAELIREMEREEEEALKATKQQAKARTRPSAAAMSMASALASYGATLPAVKSSASGGRSRPPRKTRSSKNKDGDGRASAVSIPLSTPSSLPFHTSKPVGKTTGVAMAEEVCKRMIAHQLAEHEKGRGVEQVNISTLEFFTPCRHTQTSPEQKPLSVVDTNAVSEEEATAEQDENEGYEQLKNGRLAFQSASRHGQVGRYLYVRPTSKRALSAVGAERRWLHTLRLWAELSPHPGLLPLAGAGESKQYLFTMTVWNGGESLAAAATRRFGMQKGTARCNAHGLDAVRDTCVLRLTCKAVAFYAVQIIRALDALHTQRVVYRSLTPASLQLDNEGHILLGDFGLAKRLGVGAHARTYTLCAGALGYLAPEQLQHIGHGIAVDHWAVGVLLCELLTGTHPFSSALCSLTDCESADDEDVIAHNGAPGAQSTATVTGPQEVEDEVNVLFSGGDIEEGFQRVLLGDWPASPAASRLATIDADAADLVGSLLALDPADRPCTAGRTDALIQHPWFGSRLKDNLPAICERKARPPLSVQGAAKPPKPGTGVLGSYWRLW